MGVNAILNSVSSTLAQQSAPVSVRSQASVPSAAQAISTTQNASYTSPSQTVLQNANLVNASSGFAQLGSLLEVAQSGTEQVGSILQQLQTLAQQAEGAQPSDLTSLDSEFQQLLSQIDQTTGNTTFGGTSVLDGTFSGNADGTTNSSGSNSPSLSLPDLSTQGLFAGSLPDISTPQNAQDALASLLGAQGTVGNTSNQISDLLGQISFATATVNSAISNNDAAASILTEADMEGSSLPDNYSSLLNQPGTAAKAQTGNLPPNLLTLLLG